MDPAIPMISKECSVIVANHRGRPPTRNELLIAVRQKDALLLTVADTGAGIPHADRARVFEKFERGVRQTGTGLGLSLVKSLIELHGGNVVIASASGPGTRITCRLPVGERATAISDTGGTAEEALAQFVPALA